MGGAANTIKRGVTAGLTGGLSEFARQDPFGAQVGNINPIANAAKGILPSWMTGYGSQTNPYISGPFSLDPNQLASDKSAIQNLGESQDAQNQQYITQDASDRSSARDKLSQLLTQQAQQSFAQTLPQTAEDYNAGHLLNSSGYGNEVARQQANLAAQIANRVALQGVSDIDRQSQLKQGALQNLQGFGQSGLGRQLSLEDFVNSANVAKTIGAQAAPQVSNGKGQTGALLSGVGSLAPLAGLAMGGPVGAGAGKAAGRMMGAQPLPYGQV